MSGSPEPQLNNSKVPTPSFCYNPCPGSGWGRDNILFMDFKFKKDSVRGRLFPDDLVFFYYDVAKNSELGGLIELSNEELMNIGVESGLKLKPLKQLSFTGKKHFPDKNELYFTYLTEKRSGKKRVIVEWSYQTALFAHLRNSFSHYRISYERDSFIMEDGFSNKYTMSGCVEISKLRQMIFKILELGNKKLMQVNV